MEKKQMRRCGYCGSYGHNRRTCANRPPESKDTDKKYYRKKSGRSCSYCHSENHDKRNCPKLVADKLDWVKTNSDYRKKFLEDVKENGYGVGAVIKIDYYNGEEIFYFIKKIEWDQIIFDSKYSYNVEVVRMDNMDRVTHLRMPSWFGKSGLELEQEKKYSKPQEVISKAPVEEILNSIPADWLDGSSGLPHSYFYQK